ncbi:protein PFF0380w-like [Melanaphis sacchari]|uniref:protein PFF0380w-like n=1 Tax=Melanaphis sacchari TaxID=742174 RepID=UPI000DC14A67|nr:protein PFF0380w-like [Melanaphis sacchari]
MSPSNSKLSTSCESTSYIQNKNGKRTFLTSNNYVTDDIYYKKKKPIKHSQVDINSAVLSSTNGYMTRNKLNKQLTNSNELIETTAKEHKGSRTDNIGSKRKKACRNRKPSRQISKKKLQLGYVFSNDISCLYPGKQLNTEYKKNTPSLFESDSDTGIDDFQLNDVIKNEVEEISPYISNSDNLCSTFNKNTEMRTYFNKKSYCFNNKSNIKSLNAFEESNRESSRLDKMVYDSKVCKSISHNDSTTNKSLKDTGQSANEYVHTITEDDEIIVVTESFIRQLNNEDQTIKTESQESHKENEVVSKVLSTDYELNKNNVCTFDTNIDNICNINYNSSICSDFLPKQDMDNINKSDNYTPSPFKTTNIVENSLMSIFDEPEENILVDSYTNLNDNLINYLDSNSPTSISEKITELNSSQTFELDNSNSDQSIENHPMSENNVLKEENIPCHIPLNQIESNSINDQYFHSVIKDKVKINSNSFNSKINHSCLLKDDNLNPKKDGCSKIIKNLDSKCYCKNFSNVYEKSDNYNKKNIIDNASTSNNTKTKYPIFLNPCDENDINSNKNKIIDDANISNSTTKNKPINFENDDNLNKNKIVNDTTSNNTTKNKSINSKDYDDNQVNLNKNKIIDDASTLNTTTTTKLVNLIPCDENYVYFNKNKINDDANISNSTTNNKPIDFENSINLDKNKIIDNISMSNSTTNSKPVNHKPCEQNYIHHNKNKITDNVSLLNNSKNNMSFNHESFNENYVNFNKNKINYATNNKKNYFDLDSLCNSHIVDAKIDSKNKIEVEDNFNYNTADIKYDLKTENFPGLEINPFDICHLSDNTDKINENNDSKKEFIMAEVKSNNIQSENVLSSANTNINHELSQTKITNISKDENKPVPALIVNEKETNKQTIFEPPQYKNLFDLSDTIGFKVDQICPMLQDIPKNDVLINNLFDLSTDDIAFSLNNNSLNDDDDDDDDDRLLIEDVDDNVNQISTSILKLANSSNNEKTINCSTDKSSTESMNFTAEMELCENKLMNPIKKQFSEINSFKNEKMLNIILPEEKCNLSNNNCENACLLKEENNSLDNCMSIEMCNEFYKIKSLNKNIINKNESLPKNIKDILKEMYVDELFISNCQHMIDFYNDGDQLKNDLLFHSDEYQNIQSEKLVSDVINENVEKNKNSNFNQSIPTNVPICWKTELNDGNQETNKLNNPTIIENSVFVQKLNGVKNINPELKQSNSTKEETISKSEINNYNQQKKHSIPAIKTQKSNSLQIPKNVKSNMKIRIHLREFILSNKPLNDILESKEFRNLRFFGEEEIASSIGVFLFEQLIGPPIINGLSVYRENYDKLKNEEKNKILASTNLNIFCPQIMKLTSITLALVKMLRSDTLIEVILNVIRKNVFKRQMNIDHKIDDQLIKQTVYFIDICVRLRMLKTLQIFIFDSMVFLPNKYCCVIFISLLLWKNCLPRSTNNEEDPVIITALSYIIAKKKFYSEETVGCDIFQRELINLLSCHFNYTFTTDLPTNLIQHKHKPDFSVSVVMFLKCCDPKDLVEFMVNCLFPIIDNYLNTQQDEMYAIKIMECINMTMKPFKITCNVTVATYLKKCKDPINGVKKNGKEHIYNTVYNSYKILQKKFIEYLNNSQPRSQYFEELLMSIILVLGSVDYLTSCLSLMQWKPKFELSAILSKKISLFKSILGHNIVWDKLCAIDDIKTLKCLVNSCLLNKDVYDTIIQLHNLH